MSRRYALLCAALLSAGPMPAVGADPFTPTDADEPRFAPPFAGYRGDREIEPGDWRALNQSVGRIGGWRTYAREAEPPAVAADGDPPRPAAAGERVPGAEGGGR